MFKTTYSRLGIIMILVCFYLMLPLAYFEWLSGAQLRGDFPAHADSIGIPFAGVRLAWFAGLPFLVAFCIGFEFLSRKMIDSASDTSRGAK